MSERNIGLLGATGIGVGAIVGGGILVLAGAAFAATGPAAILAFGLNGVVALLTALSIAELASRFPESGGAYTFAKKVLSVRAAFAVGWVLWFAYIVAGVLYALGFASYALLGLRQLWEALGGAPPQWLHGRRAALLLATAATVGYAVSLIRSTSGGGQWATVGKIVVFCFLIVAGGVTLFGHSAADVGTSLDPFFSGGASGLLSAMGFTFIALQGFEIIAAVGGEVKDPARVIPRAMFLSLGVALAVYLPLLFVVSTAGVGAGGHISELARAEPDTVFATAVRSYLGEFGFWLVVVAAVLSTLSALQANLLAASRVALRMAQDRTLPAVLAGQHKQRATPVMAIYATALAVIAISFMVPDLAAAGSAASLIFLVAFALAHVMTFLARVRGGAHRGGFRTPWFPAIPIGGGLACAALALFQAVVVPDAGGIVLIWLGLGIILYLSLFSQRAEITDASAEAFDPSLVRLRGRNPLVLLPIANPAHARGMVAVANALAPRDAGRVLLLSVVQVTEQAEQVELPARLGAAQDVVGKALARSYGYGHTPEALITAAPDPWHEIVRIAEEHDCEALLVGLGASGEASEQRVEQLMNDVDCDVAVMSARPGWLLETVERVLVPVGGLGDQHEVRARLLGAVCRDSGRVVTFLRILPVTATDESMEQARRDVSQLAELKAHGAQARVVVTRNDDPAEAMLEAAHDHDLIVMGLRSSAFGRKSFGSIALRVSQESPCTSIMLSRRRYRAHELWQPLRDVVSEPVRRIKRPSWWAPADSAFRGRRDDRDDSE